MRRRKDIASRELDGQIVGLDLRSARYFSLNPSATILWDLLADDVETDQLTEAIVREYGVDRERARQDVAAFVSSLRDDGLLIE